MKAGRAGGAPGGGARAGAPGARPAGRGAAAARRRAEVGRGRRGRGGAGGGRGRERGGERDGSSAGQWQILRKEKYREVVMCDDERTGIGRDGNVWSL